ncbi:U32 family peptidase C-terminal domain-containing protein [Fibrobacterota bacterium]
MKKPELTAPAGNTEKLKYALAFGADAVYAGQPRFSLRARENGFKELDDIAEAIDYVHTQGKRFYLTSNIIPHNNKVESFKRSLYDYMELGPDALIMTDPGMIQFVRRNFPGQAIHLSVQANCTNWVTARFWYELGISRIILSRELNISEIKLIHEKVPEVELEVFVHGAVCMAYSGRCLLSNYLSHRDSNQGVCSNACRYKYQLYAGNERQSDRYVPVDGEFYLKEQENAGADLMHLDEDQYGAYILSSRDICAIDYLEQLRDAGAVSFKIEGRTRSLYYLCQAVRSYKGAVDDLETGNGISPEHRETLDKLDSRGYFPGFYGRNKEPAQNYATTRVLSESAKVAAVVRGYDKVTGQALISVKGCVEEGDRLEAVTPAGSDLFQATGLRNHKGQEVQVLSPGLENCRISMREDPGAFCMLVKILESKTEKLGKEV